MKSLWGVSLMLALVAGDGSVAAQRTQPARMGPTLLNGAPVPVIMTVTVHFQ